MGRARVSRSYDTVPTSCFNLEWPQATLSKSPTCLDHLTVELDPPVRRLIRNAIENVKSTDEIHSLYSSEWSEELDVQNTLHVSLSRPLYLQTNQKQRLKAAVAKVAASFGGSV